jgi:hypothetical protein
MQDFNKKYLRYYLQCKLIKIFPRFTINLYKKL